MPRQISKPKVGEQFGLWTVIGDAPFGGRPGGARIPQVLCLCACGIQRHVSVQNMRSDKTHSCGCIKPKRTAERKTVHGDAKKGKVVPEYYIWQAMRRRCDSPNHPSYANYGGRGITVCARWHDYGNFLADMGRRPAGNRVSIERQNVDGNYEPLNCVWATPREQRLNQRRRLRIDQFTEQELLAELSRRGYAAFAVA